MPGSRKSQTLGKYALYFNSLTDTLMRRHRAYFGDDKVPELALHSPTDGPPAPESRPKQSSKQPAKEEKAVEKLEGAVEKVQNILIEAHAVFPFDPLPDTITIDRQKLTVVHRNFFFVKQTVSVQHSDIKNVQAEVGPFLGSITVTSEHFINNTQTINYLPKKDALAIKQLIQGFITAHSEGVDLTDIDDDKLVELLNKLGRGESGEKVVKPREVKQ
jgi:hypothetical protein